VRRGFGWWKVLYREDKLYGLAGINGWNKNGGPKYIEYISSWYWKRAGQNDQERVSKGFRSKSAIEREVKSVVFGIPFTLTIGRDVFLRGPVYLVRTDFAAPVLRKKEICFPNTIPITPRSADSPVAGAL
jgi:hypothetical protein